MNWNDILKNWKTTLVGLVMIGFSIYQYLQTGVINWAELVTGLAGIGFIITKDADKSHTQE